MALDVVLVVVVVVLPSKEFRSGKESSAAFGEEDRSAFGFCFCFCLLGALD